MKPLRLALLLLLTSFSAFAQGAPPAPPSLNAPPVRATTAVGPLRVVVLGDSLTAGYQLSSSQSYSSVMQQLLRSQGYGDAEVINMSVAGETAQNAYTRLPDVMAHRPDVVIVQLGLNDALRGLDPGTQVNATVSAVVDYLAKSKVRVVLFGAPLQESAGKMKSRDMKLMYYGIAKNYLIAFYPDITADIAGRKQYLQADGFHPNAEGVKIMVYKTYPLIQPVAKWKKQQADYQRKLRE